MTVNDLETLKVRKDTLGYLRAYKKATSLPIYSFVDDLIMSKMYKLPKKVKDKMKEVDPSLVF